MAAKALEMIDDEVGSRTDVKLWNENDLIAKPLIGAQQRLVARQRIFEAMLTLVIVAEDFRPRQHHEELLAVAKSLDCHREMCRDRQVEMLQAADLIGNPPYRRGAADLDDVTDTRRIVRP